jgi:hypothetical protein
MLTPGVQEVEVAVRIVLGALLLVAATAKAQRFRTFETVVATLLHSSPEPMRPIALTVVIAECVVGLLLITTWSSSIPLVGAGALFTSFTLVVALNLLFGHKRTSCGCFGGTGELTWSLVVRNGTLAVGVSLGR